MDDDDLNVSLNEILPELDELGMTKFKLAQQVALNKKLMAKLTALTEPKAVDDAK